MITFIVSVMASNTVDGGYVYFADWTKWTGLDLITKIRTNGPDHITCQQYMYVMCQFIIEQVRRFLWQSTCVLNI